MKNIMTGLFLTVLAGSTFAQVDRQGFPKKLQYSEVHQEQIKLLKCVRNILQKNRGGYEAPRLLHDLLVKGMSAGKMTTDVSELETLVLECQSLKTPSVKEIDSLKMANEILDLSNKTKESNKIVKLLTSIHDEKALMCKGSVLDADMSIFLGVGVGVGNFKCVFSDASVRNYIGLSFKYLEGSVGASVGVSSFNTKKNDFELYSDVTSASFGYLQERSYERDEMEQVLVVSSTHHTNGKVSGVKLGLKFSTVETTVGGGLRVLNGTSRWQLLLDQLN